MKKILFYILLLSNSTFAGDIIISADTSIGSSTWTIPSTTIVRFLTGGHISGTGTIIGGIIDAPLTQDIFDTTIVLQNPRTYGREFSIMWYGANSINIDNYSNIQTAINMCIANSLRNLYVPRGLFSYSKSLLISSIYLGLYVGCTLHFHGETSFWDSDGGSELYYTATTNTMALGLQLNKGSEIDHLSIIGKWESPTTVDSVYYKTAYDDYNDKNSVYSDGYSGLVIDPYENQDHSFSGSTGINVHDMIIKQFNALITISPNGETLNAEILIFQNIQCGQARAGFISSEGQEKQNVIRGIYSWESIHTLFVSGQAPRFQNGNYTIDGANVSGRCVRLFNINASGWQAVNVTNVFAENFGSIGDVSTEQPMTIENSTFDFISPNYTKGGINLLTSNSEKLVFISCRFRNFGEDNDMPFSGIASYINCFWTGAYTNVDPGGRYQITLPQGFRLNLQ